jgi:hypothetical protein
VTASLSVTPVPGRTSGAASPPQPLLVAHVPGTSVLYVVGSVTCSKAPCLRLYRTNVAASLFTPAALPPVGPAAGSVTGTLDDLVFATASVGFALIGTPGATRLYGTVDGARTWRRWTVTVPGVAESIATTAASVYLEVAYCAVTVPYCQNFRLASSPLTSDRWTSTRIPVSATSAAGSFFGPVAAYGSNVWITETGSRAFIAHSSDSGRHLSLIETPELLAVTGCRLTATSPIALWAQCSTGMLEGFWFSGNDAQAWTYVSTPRPVSGTGGGYFDPVSSTLAYLAGGASFDTLERITDAARTVTAVGRLACPDLLALVFVDVDHGLAACSAYTWSYLERTDDGGATWHRVAINPS